MDITPTRYTPPAALKLRHAEQAAPVVEAPKPQQWEAAKPVKAVSSLDNSMNKQAEKARLEAMERAIEALRQSMPDFETFTIFKNSGGEYVTRITNRSQGTVQYIPEQNVLQYLVGRQVYEDKMLELNV
jgi:uncharacterized FlaG/YvyC family protein